MVTEPFVILWRAQRQTPSNVARTCFAQLRVHYPNALVAVFRDDASSIDFGYVDERCEMVRNTSCSDVEAWRWFSTRHHWKSGLLLRDNVFIGSRPFPPFLQNAFLWLGNEDVSFRNPTTQEVVTFKEPLGLMGYFRQSFVQSVSPTDARMFTFAAIRNGAKILFPHDACCVKRSSMLETVLAADVPVFCIFENT
jgi:hypothetical protein